MKMKNVALGVDIGGTNTVFGLLDENGKIYLRDNIPTQSHETAELLFERLFRHLDQMRSESSEKFNLLGVGIGAPNGNYYTGKVENPPHLDWGIVSVIDIVKQHVQVPVVMTNDANAAALGEMKFGAAQGMKNFVEITLGTGLGSGIVVNGQLVYGHDGFAGEIGHTTIEPNGRPCGCGRLGCLEAYASATGIVTTVNQYLKISDQANPLHEIPPDRLTSRHIYEQALEGNEIALKAFEYTASLLGEALSNTVAHLSPEAIIFSGGLSQAGDILFKPIKEHLEKNLFHVFRNKVKIIPSALASGDASVLGSGALILSEITNPA